MNPFPLPPPSIIECSTTKFLPCPEVGEWAMREFVAEGGVFHDEEHGHLAGADILWLWVSDYVRIHGGPAAGYAQMGAQMGGGGKKELIESRYRDWNDGFLPDFVITLCAPFVTHATPRQIGQLVDHEMRHCSSKGVDRRGKPKWTMRGHDAEIFVADIERWGTADSEVLERLKRAFANDPQFEAERVEGTICGSCGMRV